MVGTNSTVYGGITAATTLFTLNFILKKVTFKNKKINEFKAYSYKIANEFLLSKISEKWRKIL